MVLIELYLNPVFTQSRPDLPYIKPYYLKRNPDPPRFAKMLGKRKSYHNLHFQRKASFWKIFFFSNQWKISFKNSLLYIIMYKKEEVVKGSHANIKKTLLISLFRSLQYLQSPPAHLGTEASFPC